MELSFRGQRRQSAVASRHQAQNAQVDAQLHWISCPISNRKLDFQVPVSPLARPKAFTIIPTPTFLGCLPSTADPPVSRSTWSDRHSALVQA